MYIRKDLYLGDPIVDEWVKTPTSIHEDTVSILSLTQWVKDLVLLQAALRPQMWLESGVAVL